MNGKTYKDALNDASFILKEIENPTREAVLLLSYTSNVEVSFIYAYQERELDLKTYNLFLTRCHERANGMPFQYIVGVANFYSLDFHVSQSVLIPRPETEHLVDAGLNFLNKIQSDNPIRVLDLCTGSGCIAISIASFYENCEVVAADISEAALELAKKNVHKHHLENRITLVKSDMFNQIEGKFDLILSNPPYIPENDINNLQREVTLHEPHLALNGGTDGLNFYRILAEKGPSVLKSKGAIGLEVGYDQADKIDGFFTGENAYNSNVGVNTNGGESSFKTSIFKDFSGIQRVVFITKNCIQ